MCGIWEVTVPGKLVLHALPSWLLPCKLLPTLPVPSLPAVVPSWPSPGFSWALSVLVTWRVSHMHFSRPRTLGLPAVSSWASALSLTSVSKPDPRFLTPPEVFPSLQTLRPQALAILCLLFPSRPSVCCPLARVRVGYFLPVPSCALSHRVCLHRPPDCPPALALTPHLFLTSGQKLEPG